MIGEKAPTTEVEGNDHSERANREQEKEVGKAAMNFSETAQDSGETDRLSERMNNLGINDFEKVDPNRAYDLPYFNTDDPFIIQHRNLMLKPIVYTDGEVVDAELRDAIFLDAENEKCGEVFGRIGFKVKGASWVVIKEVSNYYFERDEDTGEMDMGNHQCDMGELDCMTTLYATNPDGVEAYLAKTREKYQNSEAKFWDIYYHDSDRIPFDDKLDRHNLIQEARRKEVERH